MLVSRIFARACLTMLLPFVRMLMWYPYAAMVS